MSGWKHDYLQQHSAYAESKKHLTILKGYHEYHNIVILVTIVGMVLCQRL